MEIINRNPKKVINLVFEIKFLLIYKAELILRL